MEEKKKLIESFRLRYKAKALEGVIRLGLKYDDVVKIIRHLHSKFEVQAYALCSEGEGETEHFHFILFGRKKLYINPIRNEIKFLIKQEFVKNDPKKYLNGMLNLAQVTDPYKMLCYLCKEIVTPNIEKLEGPNYIFHAIEKVLVNHARSDSYTKVYTMQAQASRILERVALHIQTPLDATIEYRIMRNRSRKPDSRWPRFYDNCQELAQLEIDIRRTTEEYASEYHAFR